jgi:membrane protein
VRALPSSTATERRPSSPLGLRAGEWLDVLKRTGKGFRNDDCMGLAQEIAYSSLLAFFPAVILLIGLLGLIGPGAYDSLTHLLGTVAPEAVLNAIDIAKQSSTGRGAGNAVAFAAGTAGALWAASGATGSVIKAVNRANDLPETRPFWRVRLLALALVLLAGLVLAIVFLLIVFGGPLGEAIARRADLGDAFKSAWSVARWPIAFAGILLFLGIVYYLAPAVRPASWRWITPGSLLGSLLWLALSGLFALYTSFASSYDRTYGSLAGAIVLLLWLNYSAVALLVGAELNAELDRRARPPSTSARAAPEREEK